MWAYPLTRRSRPKYPVDRRQLLLPFSDNYKSPDGTFPIQKRWVRGSTRSKVGSRSGTNGANEVSAVRGAQRAHLASSVMIPAVRLPRRHELLSDFVDCLILGL